jgi:hypothetical protein
LTEKLACSGTSTPDDWLLGAGADKVSAVAEPDDDMTSYIIGDSSDLQQRYSLSAPTTPPGSTINSVTVSSRVHAFGAGVQRLGLALGGNTSESSDINMGGGWSTEAVALSRPGGGAWDQTDLAALEVYIVRKASGTDNHCSTLFVEIDYTPPAPAPPSGAMLLLF